MGRADSKVVDITGRIFDRKYPALKSIEDITRDYLDQLYHHLIAGDMSDDPTEARQFRDTISSLAHRGMPDRAIELCLAAESRGIDPYLTPHSWGWATWADAIRENRDWYAPHHPKGGK